MAQNMKENGSTINITELALYVIRMEVIQKDHGSTANLKVLLFNLTIKCTRTKALSKMEKKKVWEKKSMRVTLLKEHLKMVKDMEEARVKVGWEGEGLDLCRLPSSFVSGSPFGAEPGRDTSSLQIRSRRRADGDLCY